MPDTIDISIASRYDASGSNAASVGMARVGLSAREAALEARVAGSSAQELVAALRAEGAAAGITQTQFLELAGALSTTALAAGDAAKADQILALSLRESAAAAGGAAVGITEVTASAEASTAAASGLSGAMSALGIGMTAIVAIRLGAALAEQGAQAQLVDARFQKLTASTGTTGDALTVALRKASGGELSDTAIKLDVMKASLLGVGNSAAQLAPLLALARDRAQQMGITTEQAFDRLVTGLGRGSAKILDDLGVIVHITEVNKVYAASIGKTADALTDAEKKQALVNETLRQGAASMAAAGGAIESNAGSIQRLGASWENLKDKVGGALATGFAPTINALSDVSNGADGSAQSIAGFVGGLGTLSSALQGQGLQSAKTAEANINFATGLLKWVGFTDAAAQGLQRLSGATAGAADSAAAYRAIEAQSVAVAQASTAAQLRYANALELSGVQAGAAALAAEQKANADKVAAVDAQTHGIAEQKLAEQAQSAAAALIKAGPAGAQTAAILAGSSSQIDVLTAAYYRLAVAQGTAGKGATQQQAADFRSTELFGQTAAQTTAALQKQTNADNARSAGILQNGTNTQKITELQRLYNDAVRQSGKDSAQAITAQNALTAAQQAANKPKVGKGISALDRSELALVGDLHARLDIVNAKLASGNLTQLQRNQYLKEQADLQAKINSAVEKEAGLVNSIALAKVKDRQDSRKEDREAAGLERALAAGNQSAERQAAIRDRLEEIRLLKEKRGLDINKQERESGIVGTQLGAPPAAAPQGTQGRAAPATVGSTPVPIGPPTSGGVAFAGPTQVVVNISLVQQPGGGFAATSGDPNTTLNVFMNAARSAFQTGGG